MHNNHRMSPRVFGIGLRTLLKRLRKGSFLLGTWTFECFWFYCAFTILEGICSSLWFRYLFERSIYWIFLCMEVDIETIQWNRRSVSEYPVRIIALNIRQQGYLPLTKNIETHLLSCQLYWSVKLQASLVYVNRSPTDKPVKWTFYVGIIEDCATWNFRLFLLF
jgi:hypothetical protein